MSARWRSRLTGPSARRVGVVAGVLVVCLGVASVAVASGEGAPPARVDLRSGGAWVGSTVGLMTLIDGDSGEVVARVDVGGNTGSLVATQNGPVGYAVNGDSGSVVRVDPRTFIPSPPVEVLERPSGHVSAHASGRAVYVLDDEQGRVAIADPDNVTRMDRRGQSLAEPVASSVVDGDGRLWLLGSSSGDLVWFDGADRHDRRAAVEHPEGAALVLAGGSPAVVDPGARTIRRLTDSGSSGREVCLDVAPGDNTVRFGGSTARPWVYSISGEQGVLRVSDFDSGACKDVAISVFPGGSELGDPLESQGRVFVPNFSAGTVAVIDVAHGSVAETPEPIADGHFELFDEDGIVFYNDADSEKAGVIHLDGTVTPVAKYNPADPSEDVINAPHAGDEDPAGSSQDQAGTPPTSATDPGATAPQPPPSEVAQAGDRDGADAPPTTVDNTRPARPGETVPDPPTTPSSDTTSTSTTSSSTTSSSTTSSSTTTSTSTTSTSTTSTSTTTTTQDPGPPPDTQGPSVSVSGEFTSADWNFMVARADASDPSGVLSVDIHVRFDWFCPVGGRMAGADQSTGDIDPFTAANGWGFGADASCPDGGSWGIQGVTIWATAVDTLGNSSTSSSVRLP